MTQRQIRPQIRQETRPQTQRRRRASAPPQQSVQIAAGESTAPSSVESLQTQTLDISHLEARMVALARADPLNLVLVGVGGTGSYLADVVARIAVVLRQQGRMVRVTFIDPDRVEEANVPRQRFSFAEIGAPKAATLAWRYNAAWGLDIRAIVDSFDSKQIAVNYTSMTILLGCVDNAAARTSLAKALEQNQHYALPRIWWLDSGNFAEAGQVLLGSSIEGDLYLRDAFKTPGLCTHLPAPTVCHPELLIPLPEELTDHQLSCAELAAANAQSLVINEQMAAVMAKYLTALLAGRLRQFASYVNVTAGSMRSLAVTPRTVAQAIQKVPGFFRE